MAPGETRRSGDTRTTCRPRNFATAIGQLLERGRTNDAAIMCAEAVPWRCHRSLIGDALLVRNVQVLDIMTEKSAKPHTLTSFARVDGRAGLVPGGLTAG